MKIFVYKTDSADFAYSEVELAEAPARECDALSLYAVFDSPESEAVFATFCEQLGWKREVPDGCSRSPVTVVDEILHAAKRREIPFTLKREFGDGKVEVITRDFKRCALK